MHYTAVIQETFQHMGGQPKVGFEVQASLDLPRTLAFLMSCSSVICFVRNHAFLICFEHVSGSLAC